MFIQQNLFHTKKVWFLVVFYGCIHAGISANGRSPETTIYFWTVPGNDGASTNLNTVFYTRNQRNNP